MQTCSDITRVDPASQCSFAHEYCELNSLVPYGTLFFCSSWPFIVRLAIVTIVLLLLFATMGVAAFDYMSPNLGTLASKSGLSQSVMGVTVLAFANGSVDVFGAMVAINADEGGMAVGEIMGGALFVSAVVIGSMAIITPFQIDRHNFRRDAIFLATSVILTMLIVQNDTVTLAEALLALCLYAVYALFVVYQHLTERIPPQPNTHATPADLEAGGDRDYLSPRLSSPLDMEEGMYTPIRPSFFTAVDLNHRVSQQLHDISDAQNQSPSSSAVSDMTRRSSAPEVLTRPENIPPELIFSPPSPKPSRQQYQLANSPQRLSLETRQLLSPHNLPKLQTSGLPSSVGFNASPRSTQSAHIDAMSHSSELSNRSSPSPININELVYRVLEPQRIAAGMSSSEDPEIREEEEIGTHEQVVWGILFPAFRDWKELPFSYKCTRAVLSPFLLLQSWSIPTASTASSPEAMCVYCIGIPLALPFLAPNIDYSLMSWVLIILGATSGLIWWGRWKHRPPPTLLSAAIGFIMGLLWVLFLASELVALMRVLGAACHVSNTIMGLTVFALGDSLGDFVSNMTVARIGYPAMAVAACFGGPIFTLLIGVGGSCIVSMLIKRELELKLQVSPHVLLNGTGMLVILLYMGIALPANDWHIDRGIGIKILLLWFVVELLTVSLFRGSNI